MSRAPLDFQAEFSGTRDVAERHRFDADRLASYLGGKLAGVSGALRVREFKGGQSNPTYELRSGTARYVLRRKPPGKLLASAHAVDREFRVLDALHREGLPVPEPLLLCEDEAVIGTVFYVMEAVVGRVMWNPLLPDQSPAERGAIYGSMTEILARLHGVDPEAAGLADFGRPGNYFARQIHRWSKQYRASETEKIEAMEQLMEWLPAHLPEDPSVAVVHGDYQLNNMIVHPTEPRIAAVLDWELSTLGHPLGDLSYLLAHRRMPGSAFLALSDAELAEHGIPSGDAVVADYCARTGRDGIGDLRFYLAYNLFRTAAILQGIAGRVRDGTASSEHAVAMSANVRPLAESSWQIVQHGA